MIDYTIAAHPTMYRGVKFRSRLEATWAAFFDLLEWQWEYEPFDLKGWVPDFIIIGKNRDALVEIKPIVRPDSNIINKITSSVRERSEALILGGITFFDPELDFAMLYSFCNCRGIPKCRWQDRFIIRVGATGKEDKYDIVFGHEPYLGLITSLNFNNEGFDLYNPFGGKKIRNLWGRANNITRWKAQ